MTGVEQTAADQETPSRLRPLRLYGQVVIVTGAAKGMGKPICSMLVQEGAHVVLAGRDFDALEEHAATLNASDSEGDAVPFRCDVTREEDANALAKLALETFGRIDILVNSAGTIGPIETPAHEVGVDDFRVCSRSM